MNTNTPLVSVIISSYNHQDYVQETIKSLINQTYKNIELIIIDDGSKDLTYEKILELKEQCEKRFVQIYFEKQGNIGCAATLNKLIKKAQGDYVYMIASDDLAKPHAIECQTEFLNSNPQYGLVVGDNEIIDSNSIKCYWDEKRNNVYDINRAKYETVVDFSGHDNLNFSDDKFGTYSTLYISNYIPNGYLIRKSALVKIKPFSEEAPLEDYFLMLQLSKYTKFKYIDEILFSYRWHNNNTIKNSEKIKKYTSMTKKYEEFILNNLDYSQVYPEIKNIAKNGLLYKRQGVRYIFEIQKYRKFDTKIKILKIFNLSVFKWHKKI